MSALSAVTGALRSPSQLLLATALAAAAFAAVPTAGADAARAKVSIDAPRAGATLEGQAVVFASTRGRASKVVFYVDGVKRRTDPGKPYSYRLDTRSLSDGRHRLTVRASLRGATASASKTFTVANGVSTAVSGVEPLPPLASVSDRTSPTVAFRTPSSGSTVSGSLSGAECEARAADNVAVARVVFTIDGRALRTERNSPYNCELDSTDYLNGSHTLSAVAYDAAGNQSSASSVVIKVQNASSNSTDPSPNAPAGPVTSGPSPTTTPASPAPVAPGQVVFTGDYETGSFSQWNSTQQVGGGSAAVVSSPVNQGSYAGRFTLPSSGGRAEVYKSDAAYVGEGDERIYSWSTMAMADTIGPASAYQNILQWKNEGTGSPPIAFEVESDQYAIKATGTGFKFLGPVNPGRWTSFEVRIRFSSSASQGFIEVKRDGVLVVPRYATATLFAGKRNYLKQGYYAGGHGGTVYHDGMRVTAP